MVDATGEVAAWRELQPAETSTHRQKLWEMSRLCSTRESAASVKNAFARALATGNARVVIGGRQCVVLETVEDRGEWRVMAAGFDTLTHSPDQALRLIYGASHDLKEPLRGIIVTAELLEKRYGAGLPEDALQMVRRIRAVGGRMGQLITDLLEYAGEERALRRAIDVDVALALANVADNIRVSIEESRASIQISGTLPVVRLHGFELETILQNLILNAIKYAKPGVAPLVRISAVQAGADWCISVRDNGMGFPMDRAETIFEMFTRLHPDTSGSGLGLALCRLILDRANGSIWAESRPGEGSVFHFTLPAGSDSARSSAPQKRNREQHEKHKEQDLGDASGSSGNAAESQESRHEGDDQES